MFCMSEENLEKVIVLKDQESKSKKQMQTPRPH